MRIAFFNSEGLYDVITYFTQQLVDSLQKLDIQCEIYNARNGELSRFIENLGDPPDFTCAIAGKACFNHDFFSMQTQIPHIAYCMDAPIYYLNLLNNPYTILTFVDRGVFEIIPKNDNTHFLSLAADHRLLEATLENPCYDVLLTGACFDFESIRENWQKELPKHLVTVMENAIDMVFAKNPLSFPQAILVGLYQKGLKPNQVDFVGMCRNLENYMRGKDRLELLKSIKNAQVAIVGPHRFGPKTWSNYVGIFPNVVLFEGEIAYTKTFELIKRSKIFLNSCPSLKDGAHERVFNGFLLGSLVLSNETSYYKEFFQDEVSILFYQPGIWKGIDDKISYYLANEKARAEIVQKGKEVVLHHHTWDHRARELVKVIDQYVSK